MQDISDPLNAPVYPVKTVEWLNAKIKEVIEMKRKFLAFFLILMTATAISGAIYYMEDVGETHITIGAANYTVTVMQFDFLDLDSGENFTDTKTTTMTIENIDKPYLVFESDFNNPDDFTALECTIDVNGTSKTFDLVAGNLTDGDTWRLNSTDGDIKAEGDIPIEMTITGETALIENAKDINFLVNASVSSQD